MRREAWQAVNGFPEDLRSAEDLIFMDRVENAGYRFVFEPRAQVHWDLRPTLGATFKRFLVYSRNNIRAGLFRQWQATILMRYGVLAVLLVAALLIEPSWVWFPIAAWLLMLAGSSSGFDQTKPSLLSRLFSSERVARGDGDVFAGGAGCGCDHRQHSVVIAG